MSMRKAPFTLCVVGGGFTGAAIAIACLAAHHLAVPPGDDRAEPAARSRRRLWQSPPAASPQCARARSLDPREPARRFSQLGVSPARPGRESSRPARGLGAYLPAAAAVRRICASAPLRERGAETPTSSSASSTTRRRACVTESGRYRVGLERSAPVIADVVFLATAYGLSSASAKGALRPFESVAPDRLASARQIALIGSGLTMVDVLLAARRDGFHGTALVVSRRGQLPRPHAPKGVVPKEIGLPRSKRVSLLAAAIRISCEMAEESGTPWQAVINGLRPSLPDIWQSAACRRAGALPAPPPPLLGFASPPPAHGGAWPPHGRVRRRPRGSAARVGASGRATMPAASSSRCCRADRASRSLVEADLAFDCTGFRPDLDQPLIASLFERGLARPDPHRLGLAVERNGQVIGAGGAAASACSPSARSARARFGRSPPSLRSWPRPTGPRRRLPLCAKPEAETAQIRAAACS